MKNIWKQINSTELKWKYNDINAPFKKQVKLKPDSVALRYLNKSYTYKQVDKLSDALAYKFEQLNIYKGDVVTLFLDRSEWFILCQLACFKTGVVYVPLDDNIPVERVKQIVSESKSKAVVVSDITCKKIKKCNFNLINVNDLVVDLYKEEFSIVKCSIEDPAYILYTSGTTGIPKGVLSLRKSVINIYNWDITNLWKAKTEIYGFYSSFAFAGQVGALWVYWIGGVIDIIPNEVKNNAKLLCDYYIEHKITHSFIPTSMMYYFFSQGIKTNLRSAVRGGEKTKEFEGKSNVELYDFYGCAETNGHTMQTTRQQQLKHNAHIMGKPFPNNKVYVINSKGKLIKPGEIGEIFVSGYHLALAYVNDKKLTRKKFLDNPFDGNKVGYDKMYATGDLAKMLEDGSLVYVGRKDNQLNIRGYRFEATELEQCILEINNINDVAVVCQVCGKHQYLVAYVVSKEKDIDTKIKIYVEKHKPKHMIPDYIYYLDKMPLTSNGKVDKKHLPEIKFSSYKVKYVSPTNAIEQKVCKTFEKVLGINNIGINDNFVMLGGNSLSVIELISKLGYDNLTAADVLMSKTPKKIAQLITNKDKENINLNKYINKSYLPLNESGLNIYLDLKKHNNGSAYTIPLSIDIDKKYSNKQIQIVLCTLIKRHPALNTCTCIRDGKLYLKLLKYFNFVTKKKFTNSEKEKFYSEEFNLEKNLSRFLLEVKNNQKVLHCVFSHIIFDGYSADIFVRDFNNLLNGKKINKDNSLFEQSAYDEQIVNLKQYKSALRFYNNMLTKYEGDCCLDSDNNKGKKGSAKIEINLKQSKLDAMLANNGITENAFFCAVFAYAISKYTYTDNAYINFIDHGRNVVNFDNSIGMFVKTLPAVINCSNCSIDQYLRKVYKLLLKITANNFVSYKYLANKYLLQLDNVFQYYALKGNDNNSYIQYEQSKMNNQNFAGISMDVVQQKNSYLVYLDFSEKYNKAYINNFLKFYVVLCNQFLDKKDLSDVDLCYKRDTNLFNKFNNNSCPINNNNILDMFVKSCNKFGNNVLVQSDNEKFSYAQTACAVIRIKKLLREKNIKPGENVMFYTARSCLYVLCALGIMANDCVYVPFDTNNPIGYLKEVIKQLKISTVMCDSKSFEYLNKNLKTKVALINAENATRNLKNNVNLKNLKSSNEGACILYTSGTCSKEKAVCISQKSIINLSTDFCKRAEIKDSDNIGFYHSIGFDVHIEVFYSAIMSGASINIIPDDIKSNLLNLKNYIEENNISILDLPTAFGKPFIQKFNNLSVRSIFLGGEELGDINTERCNYTVWDSYGPTEACVYVSAIKIQDRKKSNCIGNANINTKFYILDKNMNMLPMGAVGQLYVSGPQISNCYLDNLLTQRSFVENKFDKNVAGFEKMYATGDLAQYLSDGTIAFHGRIDNQIKLRGFRINPSDLEFAIRNIKGIDDVYVAANNLNNINALIAYVVINKNCKNILNAEAIIEYLTNNYPSYVVPDHVCLIDRIPLTRNDKVDISKLPSFDNLDINYEAPSNELEKDICECFKVVFNKTIIGVNDSFDSLGGDSLKAIWLSSLLAEKHYDIGINNILEFKTPRLLAEACNNLNKTYSHKHSFGRMDLHPIQKYYFDQVNEDNYCQSICLKIKTDINKSVLESSIAELCNKHDILRARFEINKSGLEQYIDKNITKKLLINKVNLSNKINNKVISNAIANNETKISLKRNRLLAACILSNNKQSYLILSAHHLIIDGISWNIFVNDLTNIYKNKLSSIENKYVIPYSYKTFIKDIYDYSKKLDKNDVEYFNNITNKAATVKDGQEINFNYKISRNYLSDNCLKLKEDELLLLAFARSYKKLFNDNLVLFIEDNGRNFGNLNLNSTIGWFTSLIPALCETSIGNSNINIFEDACKIKEVFEKSKNKLLDYLLLVYKNKKIPFKQLPVTFNFLGNEFNISNEIFDTKTYISSKFNSLNLTRSNNKCSGLTLNIISENDSYTLFGQCCKNSTIYDNLKLLFDETENQISLINKYCIYASKNFDFYTIPTYSQLGIYLDEQSKDMGTAYSCFDYFSCGNNIKLQKLKNAINIVINNHPVLKSKINKTDNVILQTNAKINIEYKKVNESNIEKELLKLKKPFNFGESLCRFWILETKQKYYIAWDMHHIISDATTLNILKEDICRNLTSEKNNSLDLNFLNYSDTCFRYEFTKNFENDYNFYKSHEENFSDALDLVSCKSKNKAATSVSIVRNIVDDVNVFANKLGISLSSVYNSCFAYTLSCFTYSQNVSYNFINNIRNQNNSGEACGMYSATVPAVISTNYKFVEEYLKNSYAQILNFMEHGKYAYVAFKDKFNFNSKILFEDNSHINNLNFDKPIYIPNDDGKASIFDFVFIVNQKNDNLICAIQHSEKFSKSFVTKFAKAFSYVLKQMLNSKFLSDINIRDNVDIKLFNTINKPERIIPENDILAWFNKSCTNKPNNKFLSANNFEITYSIAAYYVNCLCKLLKAKHCDENSKVAVLFDSSPWSLISMLSVLAVGATYVPININLPIAQIRHMIKDANCSIAILDKDANIINLKVLNNVKIINIDKLKLKKQTSNEILFSKNSINKDACILYTSGSSGKPKGVRVTRKAINNLCYNTQRKWNVKTNDVFGIYPSIGFDAFIVSAFTSIICSGSVCFIPADCKKDIQKLKQYISDNKINNIYLPTVLINNFSKQLQDTKIKNVFTGGSVLNNSDELLNNGFANKIIDGYGPSECCAYVSDIRLSQKKFFNSVGNANINTKLYVLDKNMNICPAWAVGMLYVSGAQVSSGYINQPKLNKESFINNPFSNGNEKYKTMYKTGDLAQYLPDGTISFVGRIDNQVKINGNRVEPEELQLCIRNISFVKDVYVNAEVADENVALIAYVVLNKNVNNANDKIYSYVQKHKPSYMLPKNIVYVKKIPTNINGKIDKQALKKELKINKTKDFADAQNYLEQVLCDAFSKLFKRNICVNDNFISLGGDSLAAIKLVSMLDDINVNVYEILKYQTPKLIAQNVKAELKLNNIYTKQTGHPLTELQLSMYLDIQNRTSNEAYVMYKKFQFIECASKEKIVQAITKVLNFNPELQSRVALVNNKPWIKINKKPEIEYLEENNKDDLELFIRSSLDISKSLSSFCIIKEMGSYCVYAKFHHLVFDFYSSEKFKNKLNSILASEEIKVDLGAFQLAEYDQKIKDLDLYKEAKKYYQQNLKNLDECSNLIEDGSANGGNLISSITTNKNEIDNFIYKNNISKASFFSAVFAYTLSCFTNSNYVQFCIASMGRNLINVSDSLGFFAKTSPVIYKCNFDNTSSYIKQCNDLYLNALKYDFYPLRTLIKEYAINPNIVFQYLPFSKNIDTGVFKDKSNDINQHRFGDKFISDLLMYVEERRDNYRIDISYSKKYNKNLVASFCNVYKLITKQIIYTEKLSRMNLCDEKTNKLYANMNDTSHSITKTLYDIFKANVKKYPNSKCVMFDDAIYSYKEVDDITNNIANLLKKKGVNKNDKLAFMVEKGPMYLLLIISAVKLQATYVPLDENLPNKQIKYIFNDLKSFYIVSDVLYKNKINNILGKCGNFKAKQVVIDKKSMNKDASSFIYKNNNEDLDLCIIYTSGTTGSPKGIIIKESSVVNLCNWYKSSYKIKHTDTFAYLSSIGFIAHVTLFFALNVGACIDVVPNTYKYSINKLDVYFDKHKVSHAFMTASFANLFLNKIKNKTLKVLQKSGETSSLVKAKNNICVFDAYGATEISGCCIHINNNEKNIFNEIGKPINNCKTYITDRNLNKLPTYCIGEICVSGIPASARYFNDEYLNSIKYVDNPLDNHLLHKTLCKTGDLGYFNNDGNIVILGRNDRQININGNRVNLAEVENCINQLSYIDNCLVSDYLINNKLYIVAYVISKQNNIEDKVKVYVKDNLPHYMVPSFVVCIDKFPQNINGKVNKHKLPKPDYDRKEKFIKATTKTEKEICRAYSKVLGIQKVSVSSSFTSLGGDSLSAVEVLSNLSEYNLSLNDIISGTSIKNMAIAMNKSNVKKFKKQKYYPLNNMAKLIYDNYYSIEEELRNKYPYYTISFCIEFSGISSEQIINALNKVLDNHLLLKAKLKGNKFLRRDKWYPEIEVKEIQKKPSKVFLSLQTKAIDYKTDDLFRAKMYRYKKTSILLMDVNHIVCDGAAMTIVIKELIQNLSEVKTAPEKLNAYDYLLNYKNQSLYKNEIFTKSKKDFKTTLIPKSGKNHTKLPLGGERYILVNKKNVVNICKKNNISVSNYFMAALVFSIIKTEKTKEVSLFTLHHGRRKAYLWNMVACLFDYIPISYFHKSGNSIIEVAKNLEIIVKNNSKFIYPYELNKHFLSTMNLLYNYIPGDESNIHTNDEIKLNDFINKHQIKFRQLSVKQSANLRLIVNAEDYDENNFRFIAYLDTNMYGDGSGLKFMNYLEKYFNNL